MTTLLWAAIIGIAYVLTICFAVPWNFARLGLADSRYALGLPQGTVRAIIALSLIVLFGITSIYMFGQLKDGRPQIDFAKQLLTTIATLVVAIAGFYFGTRAVAAARGAVEAPTASITLDKTSPTTVKKGESLEVKVTTDPPNEAVTGKVEKGDKPEALTDLKNGKFRYTPGDSAEETTLTFSLKDNPEEKASLVVNVESA